MSIIDEIKDRLSLVVVMRQTGGAELAETEDGNATGWHTDHDSRSKNSLRVYGGGSTFKCFHCGIQGDVIDWLGHRLYGSSYDSRDPVQAVDALREGATMAGLNGTPFCAEEEAAQRQIEETLSGIAAYYHQQLSDEWRQFYQTRYGFSDETIDDQMLGFAPPDGDALWKYLRKGMGLTVEETLATGLVVRSKNGALFDLFQGRLVFPYWRRGKVVYFAARQTSATPQWTDEHRQLVDDTRKYVKQMVHSTKHDYVSPYIRNNYFHSEDVIGRADTLFVTEGIADCILSNQMGFACISPVTVRIKRKTWPRLLLLVARAKTLYLVNDNEDSGAGEEGSLATAGELWRHGIAARLIDLPRPDGVAKVDLNDFLRAPGPEAFASLLPSARTLLDIQIESAASDEPARRVAFALLAQISDAFQHVAWRQLPARLGITKSEYDRLLKAAQATARTPSPPTAEHPRYKVEHRRICERVTRQDKDGNETFIYEALCQFSAKIVANSVKDDGEQTVHYLRISGARADGELFDEFEIVASHF